MLKRLKNYQLPRDVEVSLGWSENSERICLTLGEECLVIFGDFLHSIIIMSSSEDDSWEYKL